MRLVSAALSAALAGPIALPAQAQALDGRWRGTTSGTPSGGNCRPFTFDLTIAGATGTGTAMTPHQGAPVQWSESGAVSGNRIILLAESTDRRLRNPSTRWRGERRGGALELEQIGSHACNPTRAGALKRS